MKAAQLLDAYKGSKADILILSDDLSVAARNHPESSFLADGEDFRTIVPEDISLDGDNTEFTAVSGGKKYDINIFGCGEFYIAEVRRAVGEAELLSDPIVKRRMDHVISQITSIINNMGFALDNLADKTDGKGRDELNILDDGIVGIYGTLLPVKELIGCSEIGDVPCCVSDIAEKLCRELKMLIPSMKIEADIADGLYGRCSGEMLEAVLTDLTAKMLERETSVFRVSCMQSSTGAINLALRAAAGDMRSPERYEEMPADAKLYGDEFPMLSELCEKYGVTALTDLSEDCSSPTVMLRIERDRSGAFFVKAPDPFAENLPVARFSRLKAKLTGHMKFPRY